MSKLVKHAEAELKRAGWFKKSGMYDGMIGDAVMRLVRVFADAGHSGQSAMITLNLFNEVARWRPLTKLTDSPREWNDIAKAMSDKKPLWQSRRKPSCFSNDGGKTYYDIDEKKKRGKRVTHTSENARKS